jgi:hypothetical protein
VNRPAGQTAPPRSDAVKRPPYPFHLALVRRREIALVTSFESFAALMDLTVLAILANLAFNPTAEESLIYHPDTRRRTRNSQPTDVTDATDARAPLVRGQRIHARAPPSGRLVNPAEP